MTPSRQHYMNLNEAEFRYLVPEHAASSRTLALILDLYSTRKRCRNILVNADLVVNHERILRLEKDGEVLSPDLLEVWAKEDSEDDTDIIERPVT